ncbi:hypothetical protein K501DRAFT_331845 [Backusella circina FSU 941]|nr:hypothetical protein K501DRAFT_331845 [Backusella circina FSU 941]
MTETEPKKIAFLIDEHSLQNNVSLDTVKLAIMRLLIYYHSILQPNSVVWSFRFFSTSCHYPNSGTRTFHSISEASLKEIETQYQERETAGSNSVTGHSNTPITYLKRVLTESLADFRWGTTDSPSQKDKKQENIDHYLHIITSCPYTESAMVDFYDPSVSFVDALAGTQDVFTQFLGTYKSRHISLNLIDTDKSMACKPRSKGIDRCIRTQFESIMLQFGGQYLPLEMLTKKYSTYGYDFLSEFITHLPSTRFPKKIIQPLATSPVWSGEFKTKSLQNLGDFSLYHAHKVKERDTSIFLYVEEIVMEGTLHRKQVVPAWIIKDQPQINPGFFLCCVNGDKWGFRNLLKQLHQSQLVILAKLVPLDVFKGKIPVQKVVIEPVTTNVASVQLVDTKNFPHVLPVDTENGIEEYPIGCNINNLITINPTEIMGNGSVDSLDMEPPSFLKDLMFKRERDDMPSIASPARNSILINLADTPTTSIVETINREYQDSYDDKTEEEEEEGHEEVIELPADINAFGKSLKSLYMEVLYRNKYPMSYTIEIIDNYIQHLVKYNHSKQDIVNQLYIYTLSNKDLNEKHANTIPNGWRQPFQHSTFEQVCLFDWWEGVKSKPSIEEKNWLITLKFKEAQLQVILYCFITKLLPDTNLHPEQDPADLAEKFFSQIVISHAIHRIDDFLQDKDRYEYHAVDFTDTAFMELLEDSFPDLNALVLKFREAVDMDETEDEAIEDQNQNIPARTIPTWDELNVSWAEKSKQRDVPKPPPSVSSLSSNRSRKKIPAPPKRQTSNLLDTFQKRSVSMEPKKKEVDRISEASKAADAKVLRSKVNGEATMKRKHGFLKSAKSPERVKPKSRLSTQESGTVVLRRTMTSPTTPTTPRTRRVRDWENNIFANFQEPCPSPSNNHLRRESIEYSHYDNHSLDMDQLGFSIPASPNRSARPKTPQSTPKRYKKIFTQSIHGGRQHHYEESESMKIPITSLEPEETTPKTSMRRKKSMGVDQVRPSRNLTSQFEAMRDVSPENSHASSQTNSVTNHDFWKSDFPSIALPEED